jgi:hypothetical protein
MRTKQGKRWIKQADLYTDRIDSWPVPMTYMGTSVKLPRAFTAQLE